MFLSKGIPGNSMLWIRPSDIKTVQRGGESKLKKMRWISPSMKRHFRPATVLQNAHLVLSVSIAQKYKQQLNRKTYTKYNVHCPASLDSRQVKWLVYVILCAEKDCQV